MKGMKEDAGMAVRGILMGAANVVPGVSGGTIALITGIYPRLVDSIASFDMELVALLRQGKLKRAAEHADLRFLASLCAGVGIAIVGLAKLITWLIAEHPVPTWSFFFGLILASALLIYLQSGKWGVRALSAAVVGAGATFILCGLMPAEVSHNAVYLFFSGAVAIIAMILPGISGSFILVLLGQYAYVLEAVHTPRVGVMLVFSAGCGAGLLAFGRVLKFLLDRHYDVTMAFLCGMMIGALRKVWPFKMDAPGQELVTLKHRIQFNVLPDSMDKTALWALGMCAAGIAVVFLTDRLASRSGKA